ncbi:MAG TPA: cupin domain-containing protein [Caproicibacter sp.]|nr:cupin domain-containing protein [Caproicibacter sp.]
MSLTSIQPTFIPTTAPEPPSLQRLISALHMQKHIEGGWFAETDRAPDTVPAQWVHTPTPTNDLVPQRPGFDPNIRNSSTSIFYLLTPATPQGGFHRNKGRTIHTLHRGRGRYVIIHDDEDDVVGGEGERGERGKRIETFVVGQDVEKGEKLQWVVEGWKYKASFLLPDEEGGRGE